MDLQVQCQVLGGVLLKLVKLKFMIFFDVDVKVFVFLLKEMGLKGWDIIGLFSDWKKENMMEVKLWVGEMLKVGGKKLVVVKMLVFRDLVS